MNPNFKGGTFFTNLGDRFLELETTNKFLLDELQAAKKALSEAETKASNRPNKEAIIKAIKGLTQALEEDVSHDRIHIAWNCAWGFVGEAIRQERMVVDLCTKHNEAVLAYEAEKKLRAEAASQISALSDAVDSATFELIQVRREKEELLARSQRQAERITALESEAKSNKDLADAWRKDQDLSLQRLSSFKEKLVNLVRE